jgi:glycosyltransferase involved in cell wall biosynthesis
VTVALITRNRRKEIPRALRSVFAQEGAGQEGFLEVVVVDDGSTDGTGEMIATVTSTPVASSADMAGDGNSPEARRTGAGLKRVAAQTSSCPYTLSGFGSVVAIWGRRMDLNSESARPSRPEDEGTVAVTVLVVTHNRRRELARALESILSQEEAPEVVVVDDASSDGTSEMVVQRFPTVRLLRHEQTRGTARSRNHGMSVARGRIVVCLDDDAWLPSPRTVQQTLGDFDDPRIGAVAIPFTDVEGNERTLRHASPAEPNTWVAPTFIGAAYAVRADAFRRVGGYRSELPMYGEESDLSLRLLDAGYVVRLGRADPAQHEPSPVRSLAYKEWSGRRNEIIWVWLSFPRPWHLVYLAGYTLKGIRYGLRIRRLGLVLRGLARGFAAIPGMRRQPVGRRAFRLDRRLRRHKALPLSQVAAVLGTRASL